MRNKKIVLINSDGEYKRMESNKGAEAVLISSVEILKKYYPDADYTTTIQLSDRLRKKLHCNIIENNLFYSRTYSIGTFIRSTFYLLRCYLWAAIRKYCNFDCRFLINNKKLMAYVNADLIVHLGMDLYSDDFGILTIIEHSKDLLQATLLGKNVVLWAESIGPFNGFISKAVARFTLSRINLITVREEISKSYLESLKLKNVPIYVTMDPAFVMGSVSKKEADTILNNNGLSSDLRPLVGMCFSLTYLAGGVDKKKKIALLKIISKTLQFFLPEKLFIYLLKLGKNSKTYSTERIEYTKDMAKVVDHLVEEFNATILLIPHIQHPLIGEKTIHEMIFNYSMHKDNVKLISKDYTAQEIKGIIGQCDLFIGGRMHSDIAALSQCVPTIGLSYSYKFQGIMKLLNLSNYVCTDIKSKDIIAKVHSIWNLRDEIKEELSSKNKLIVEKANLNGELCLKLVS